MKEIRVGVVGMHCASCAQIIEKTLKKTAGVSSVEVNYATEKAKITLTDNPGEAGHHADLAQLNQAIKPLGYSLRDESAAAPLSAAAMGMSENEHAAHLGLNQSQAEKLAELAALKINVLSMIPLAIISIFVMTWEILARLEIVTDIPEIWMEFFHHLLPLFAVYSLFVVGRPYLLGLIRFLRYGRANMDTLIGLGTLTAIIYSFIVTAFEETLRPFLDVESTYYDVAIVVIAFITLGKYLEMRSKLKTGDAIAKLLNLQAKTALVIRDGQEKEVPIGEVRHGDLIIIKPAGKIPVDGVITAGSSYVDEALVTGEAIPVEKNVGDSVVAGTINTSGAFTFRATKVGSETLLAHIIKMVEEAQGSKAPIQALADKISGVFVPVVLGLALITLAAWLIIGTPALGFSRALSFGLSSFVGMLVIACPCALGLATPTAIIVGVGKGAKEGILVKDAAALEKLHKVRVLVADKTGTITKGRPELMAIKNWSDQSDDELIGLLASLENNSEHPIAAAIVSYAKQNNIKLAPVAGFEAIKGRGLRGTVAGREYRVGNLKLMVELGLSVDGKLVDEESSRGRTPILLADQEKVLGLALVADDLKPEAKKAIADLHALGIRVVMLTGDHRNTAKYIADQVGIDEVISEVMPADKLAKIKELQAQGLVVAMAGDGINDAPALAQADVGIAMATGTDIAIDSAGLTLLHGDIAKIVKAIRLSRLTMRGIKQNLFWAFIYNIVGLPLAAGAFYPLFGWLLNPVFAGLAMAGSSVSVVGNSLRLKAKRL